MTTTSQQVKGQKRARRVRHALKTLNRENRPRLSVFKSNEHIYAQIIDDTAGTTLASASTVDKSLRTDMAKKSAVQKAESIGAELARRAVQAGIQKVYFDRGSFRYMGRVKALADAARANGLTF